MPLYRRMPKLVGRPMGPGHVRANYGLLKVDVLNKCTPNSEVTYETCLEQGLMTKVLANHRLQHCSAAPAPLLVWDPLILVCGAAANQEGHHRLPRPPAGQGDRLQRRRARHGQAQRPGAALAVDTMPRPLRRYTR
jgi:hypothetical protein